MKQKQCPRCSYIMLDCSYEYVCTKCCNVISKYEAEFKQVEERLKVGL